MRHAIVALLLLAGALPAQAQDKTVTMKVSLWVPPAHPLVPATQAWAADIEKASGGTIKTTVFPSEQLGKAFDHYDMARDGIADVTYVNPGYQPGRFPIIAAGQMPFVFGDGKKGTQALDAWYREIRRDRDEGHEILLRLHPRSRRAARQARRSWCPTTSRA